MKDELRRVRAFERWVHERCANRKYEHRWGIALFNEDVPNFYELNQLAVDDLPDGVTADDLAAEAEQIMSLTACKHRKIVIYEESAGERVADGFAALGWDVERLVFMVHRHEPDQWSRPGIAVEITPEAHLAAKDIFNRREPWAQDEETARQLLKGAEIVSHHTNERCFGARSGGVIASIAEMYSDGSTAQIEDVATLKEHRGKGLARAVVLEALKEALASSHDLVFLIADAEDWPCKLYEKLGFETVGGYFHFVKRPPGHPGFKEKA